MSWHEIWHVTVLVVTLVAGSGLAIVLLAPLVLDSATPGLLRARPWVLAITGLAALLLGVEWLGIHGG